MTRLIRSKQGALYYAICPALLAVLVFTLCTALMENFFAHWACSLIPVLLSGGVCTAVLLMTAAWRRG